MKTHLMNISIVALSTLLFSFGCASKKKEGQVSASDKESWKQLLEIPVPEWESVDDSDLDNLLGDTSTFIVENLANDMKEIRTKLTTNRDYVSFTKSVAARAASDNISNDEAASKTISDLKTKASGEGEEAENAALRLKNVQEALDSVKSQNESLLPKVLKVISFVQQKQKAVQGLKSKADQMSFLEKAQFGKKVVGAAGQMKDFMDYAGKCKEFTAFMKRQIENPAWNS